MASYIEDWLNELKLRQYLVTFKENDIDMRLLLALGEDELLSLGVTNAFHRRKMLVGIEVLREKSVDISNQPKYSLPPSLESCSSTDRLTNAEQPELDEKFSRDPWGLSWEHESWSSMPNTNLRHLLDMNESSSDLKESEADTSTGYVQNSVNAAIAAAGNAIAAAAAICAAGGPTVISKSQGNFGKSLESFPALGLMPLSAPALPNLIDPEMEMAIKNASALLATTTTSNVPTSTTSSLLLSPFLSAPMLSAPSLSAPILPHPNVSPPVLPNSSLQYLNSIGGTFVVAPIPRGVDVLMGNSPSTSPQFSNDPAFFFANG